MVQLQEIIGTGTLRLGTNEPIGSLVSCLIRLEFGVTMVGVDLMQKFNALYAIKLHETLLELE